MRCKYVPKYIDTDNRRRGQQKTCRAFLIFMLISVTSSWYGDNGVTVVHTRKPSEHLCRRYKSSTECTSSFAVRLFTICYCSIRFVMSINNIDFFHMRYSAMYHSLSYKYLLLFLRPTTEEVYVFARAPAFVCLSVCLSVCVQDYSKTSAWIWIKCCVSTDVGTWTNWLTFKSDPDHSPDADAGTWLLSPIAYALQRGILLRREICIRRPSQQQRVVLRRRNTVVTCRR